MKLFLESNKSHTTSFIFRRLQEKKRKRYNALHPGPQPSPNPPSPNPPVPSPNPPVPSPNPPPPSPNPPSPNPHHRPTHPYHRPNHPYHHPTINKPTRKMGSPYCEKSILFNHNIDHVTQQMKFYILGDSMCRGLGPFNYNFRSHSLSFINDFMFNIERFTITTVYGGHKISIITKKLVRNLHTTSVNTSRTKILLFVGTNDAHSLDFNFLTFKYDHINLINTTKLILPNSIILLTSLIPTESKRP